MRQRCVSTARDWYPKQAAQRGEPTCEPATRTARPASSTRRLQRATITVVVGEVGSGKSTLLEVPLTLRHPDAGRICWNGAVVATPAEFMQPPRVAYKTAVAGLLSDTLKKNNVLLGLSKAASVCVFGEFDWSPGVYEQCIGPLGRDGVRGRRVLRAVRGRHRPADGGAARSQVAAVAEHPQPGRRTVRPVGGQCGAHEGGSPRMFSPATWAYTRSGDRGAGDVARRGAGAVLLLIGAACIYPFVYIASVSISDGAKVASGQIYRLPKGLNFETYRYIFSNPRLGIVQGVVNSVLYTVVGTVVAVLLMYFTAYVLSRKRFRGRHFIMMAFVASWISMTIWRLVNSRWVMILPGRHVRGRRGRGDRRRRQAGAVRGHRQPRRWPGQASRTGLVRGAARPPDRRAALVVAHGLHWIQRAVRLLVEPDGYVFVTADEFDPCGGEVRRVDRRPRSSRTQLRAGERSLPRLTSPGLAALTSAYLPVWPCGTAVQRAEPASVKVPLSPGSGVNAQS